MPSAEQTQKRKCAEFEKLPACINWCVCVCVGSQRLLCLFVSFAFSCVFALDWNKEHEIGAFSRSTDKPRMEHCEDQNGTITYIRAVQGNSHGARINPTLFSSQHISCTGGRIKTEKHETSLFRLSSKPPESAIKTADDRLDRTSS